MGPQLQIAATPGGDGPWATVAALVEQDGSARHPHARRLGTSDAPRRDLADAVHALCTTHGGQPGLADEALIRALDPPYARWLDAVARGFAAERAGLSRVVSASGPLPSTPGQAATEAALATQRHAFQMLGRSDRAGCAAGAVAALVLDWPAIHRVIAQAARCFDERLGPPTYLSAGPDAADMLARVVASPSAARAAIFGAQQLLAQHRGFWTLLEARAAARDA